MPRHSGRITYVLLLTILVTIARCDNADKYCKHITCTKVDKDCTKPLKPAAYCACVNANGNLDIRYGLCPDKKMFNGKNDKCEEDSESSRAFCKKQSG
uniref:Putative conserved plasma membrane protein n=1 Tax=Culex tarsalis TaxID=7177 RepID=A0A1Q3FU47_CULTA